MTNNIFHIHSPLDQFEVRNLIEIDIMDFTLSINTITLYVVLAFTLVLLFFALDINRIKLISNKWVTIRDSIYDTVHSIVRNQINTTRGQVYFPFIFTLFTFILSNNLIGMIPYSFAATSHFILTFFLSFTIVTGATFLAFREHGFKFFSLFVPAGCPLFLLPLLVLIEFISYLSRTVSLGLRLGANILAGHMLLNILSGFTYKIMSGGLVKFALGLLPLSFIIAFSGLELGIAFIQAQVFVVLSCSYIKDCLDLH